MARLTNAEMLAVYERLQGEPPEKTQEYMDTLDNEQKSQYFNFCMDEKRRRDKEKAKADEDRRRKKDEEKAAARIRAEEERRAKLTPEERAKEDRNVKIGCGIIIALVLAVGAWLFWPKSEEEIARENQIKAEQQAAKQAEVQKAAAEKAAALENTKSAFKTWNSTVQGYLQAVDTDWEQLWKGTAIALGNNSMDRFTAYNNIDTLEKRLEKARDNFTNLRSPEGISDEQEGILNKANADYVTWIYARREACQKFKEMLDSNNVSPAKMKDITDTISQGDAFAMQAAAGILDVENQLGLMK